ncbi:hypothetical protein CsSME_00041726 [Camellia sinensis var. sinensis]
MAANVINNIDHSLLQDKGSRLEAIATGMLDASLSWKDYDAENYKLYEEVGEGVSATVHRALCIPLC